MFKKPRIHNIQLVADHGQDKRNAKTANLCKIVLPFLPARFPRQTSQAALMTEQSESQWLAMVTLPGRATVLVTSHPSIHFLIKTTAVMAPWTLWPLFLFIVSLVCIGEKKKKSLYTSLFLFLYFNTLLWFLCHRDFLRVVSGLCPSKYLQFLGQYRGNYTWEPSLFISPWEK